MTVEPRSVEAFDAFVRARLMGLLLFGRMLTGSEQAASDLVQDALERTLVRWSTVHEKDPEGYVRRVMVTRNVSWWRRLRRERLTEEVPDRPGPQPPDEDPELWAALARLPERQRAVVALRYLEDLSEAETAGVLGVSVGTVKSHTSRATAALRAMLTDPAEHGEGRR